MDIVNQPHICAGCEDEQSCPLAYGKLCGSLNPTSNEVSTDGGRA